MIELKAKDKDRNVTPKLKANKFTQTFRDYPNCCPPFSPIFLLSSVDELVKNFPFIDSIPSKQSFRAAERFGLHFSLLF
jgi:hypothetical protein